MEAKDFRIGNYVFVDNPEHWASVKSDIFYITGIKSFNNKLCPEVSHSFDIKPLEVPDKSYIQDPELHQMDRFIKPIELSKERLNKLGLRFYKEFNCWVFQQDFRLRFEYKFQSLIINIDGEEWPIELKYVHQLQNLYFALTGKELTLAAHPTV